MSSITAFHEIPESRELGFDPPTATTHWVCEGVFDDLTVANLALGVAPAFYVHPRGLLYRDDIKVKEKGHKLYDITVEYALENKEIGSYRIEFDTMGGTVHVKAGQHVAEYPAGSPTHDGLIGVKGDDVEGVDIVIPAMRIIVHYQHPGNFLTNARVRLLSRLAGTVDTGGFFGWNPYETLFLGAQGSQQTTVGTMEVEQNEEVSYHFAMSENLTNFSIGSISGVSKRGWDVAWVKWREAVEGGRASNEVEYVNVVKVYKEASLKDVLGFG